MDDRSDRHRLVFIAIGVIGSIAILIIAATAKVPTYHVNPIFLIPLA